MIIHKELPAAPIAVPPAPHRRFQQPADCPVVHCSAISRYEKELEKHRATEDELRQSVLRESALLRQKDELIQQQNELSREAEHRLLNGLQLITSLLSIQSRATQNAEAAALLTAASNRVAAIGRVHRHLHTLDHVESVEFKQYLESLCSDLSGMTANEPGETLLTVEGVELRIPTTIGTPLALIASELITNAIKYAKGKIAVGLHTAGKGYVLSVSDDGPGLPKEFDPAAARGLGMKLISSLVRKIGGQLDFAPGIDGKGTRFAVLFS
ncbi:MAG: sensor histidine kinase [Pseudolabrys sp.]|nr:sensor histidine kinase [Pseudolabrys sp.]MDP2298074.1 sensor histidine kinase [Pseudolabrys sp.]